MIKRRDLISSAVAATAAVAQEKPLHDTVYIPKAHRVEDLPYLQDFMDENSFVDLVTTTPSLHITHIPVLLDRSKGANGTIFGHIARNNPQVAALTAGDARGTIVFRGPHAYISPSWYTKPEAVPTWNFAAVHASGVLHAIEDKKELRGILSHLISKFEAHLPEPPTYEFDKLPDSYVNGMLGGIVGFELKIDTLEGKFKLGQERSETDKASIVKHLKAAKPERTIADLTASFYQRK